MADVSDEVYSADSHRSYHRRDRTDRRRANRYGDGLDAVSPSTEYKSSSAVVEDSGVINDLTGSGSADRDSGRRDRRERRKPKEEPEINANDKAPSEGAAATPEERSPKKSLKKESRKSENSARKRQDKKHLREKRRSTGVVMMPPSAGGDSGDDDEVAKQVNANTAKNEQLVAGDEEEQLEDTPRSQGSGNKRIKKKVQKDSDTIQTQQLLEKIDDYEQQLEDYKNELEKVNKELSQLRVDYQKLRDENSSLLNLIGHCQLPAVKPK